MDPEQENYMWLIEQCKNYATDKKPKLKCPDTLQIYNLQKKLSVPNFKVNFIEPESIKISLDQQYTNQSIIEQSYELKISNTGKFIYDFTYNISTYQKLSDIYYLDNAEDEMTPGKIIETHNFYLVIIYKINRVEVDEDGANRIFTNEKNLYFSQLCERTIEKNIYLFIIVTTPDSIITNADKMPQYLVDNLISRYLFSIAVGEKIENELKINVFEPLKINEYQQQFESIFKSINIDLPSDTYFTTKVIENCTRPVVKHDFEVTQRHVYDAIKLAEKKLAEEVMEGGKINPTFIKRKRLAEIDHKFGQLCLSQGNNVRKYPKSVMQLPYIVLKVLKTNSSNNDMDVLNWDIGYSTNATHTLIKTSIQCIKDGLVVSYLGMEKKEIDDLDFVMKNKQVNNDTEHTINLTHYHRIKPLITYYVGEQLSMFGVDFDKYGKNSQAVREYDATRQMTFSLKDTNTKDIDDWLKSSDHFKRTSDNYLESEKYSSVGLIMEAIEKSSTNENDVKFAKNKLDRFLSSRIGRWAKLVSDIGIELSMSDKHTISNGEWILKKLKNYNLYILFKPDRKNDTTYFTLFWNNCDEVFSRGRDEDSCWVTKNFTTNGLISWIDVISANSSKLVNWVKFESQLLCNSVFECENFETIFMKDEDLFLDEELNQKINYARQSFLLNILVMLNDRFALDELMSYARFMIMEGFKSLPLVPNPGKMLNKFSKMYRSRIEVWVAKQLVQTSKKIIKSFGYKCSCINEKNKKFKWIGLFDPFLHIPLETPDQLINSMYYNYAKNENEKPIYSDTALKLVTKVLDYEEKLPCQNTYLGNKSRYDSNYETHEFSPEVVRVMSQKLGEKLKYKLGPSWKTILKGEIFDDLNEKDLESISTLKASASFTETGSNYQNKRSKVAEGIKNLWLESGKKGWKAIHLLPIALKKTKDSGGLHIDLFKKNQHGGLREIYVLSISSRIIQLIIEQISRTLCNQFKSEIITHTSLKLTTPADHCEQAKNMKKGSGSNITVCTSDDATKWNQGHFVTKFAIMLCQLTDPLFHPFIISSLDLWTRKKILIPIELLNSFDEYMSQGIYEIEKKKYLNRMYQCYIGVNKEKWMDTDANYIQTASGMMQGILHLTSSLFHTLIQEFMKDEAKYILEKTFSGTDSVITVMQSSDDSGMIISLPTDNENDAITKMLAITTIFYIKHEIGKMIGIYPSEKCTVGTINIYEFNSEFFILGSSVRPTRKWLYGITGIVKNDSLYARQEQNYPLISKVLEGAGSGITTWFCQISQAMLHYRMLGCSISPLWSRYAERIINILDPTLGFYYIDNAKFCGLTSCRFGLWFLSEKSGYLAQKLKNILNTTAEKRLEKKEQYSDLYDIMGVLNAGIVTTSNTNKHKKWNNVVNNLQFDPEWTDKVENCPSILYQRAQNADEFELRLAVKMHSPGASSDLYSGNYISKIIISAINVLGNYVLKPFLNKNKNNHNNKILSEEEKNILFPLRNEYMSLVCMANKIDLNGSVEYQNLKKKRFNLTVFKSPIPHDYSLEKLVAWKWFNIDIPASSKITQMMFDDYKKNIKWLKDTPEETLVESPFLNHIMMQSYFISSELNDHIIHLSAAYVTSTNKCSALKLFLSQNMWPNWKPQQENKIDEISDNFHLLSQGIYMTVQSEMKHSIINDIIFKLLKYSAPLQAPSSKLQIYRSARPTLYLIQKLAFEFSPNRANVVDSILLSKRIYGLISKKTVTNWIVNCINSSVGCFGTFALKQQIINGKNKGPFIWSGRMNECLVRIHGDSYENYDTCVTKIVVNKSEELRAVWHIFKQWTMDHNAKFNILRSYDIAEGDKIIARVLNNRLCPETLKTTLGIPVVISNSILSKIDDGWFDIQTVLIDADQESIRVKIKMKTDKNDNSNQFMTAVFCPMEYLEKSVAFLPINSYNYFKNTSEIWRYYATLQSLPIDQTDMILEAIIKKNDKIINDLGYSSEILLKKLKESFWYCAEKMNLGLENLLIEEKKNSDEINMINNKFNNLQEITLKNLNGGSLFKKNLVEEFVLLNKEFHDQFVKGALEEDLKLYTGVQDNVFNVIENGTISRFINDMPKPLIRKWMEKIISGRPKITRKSIMNYLNDSRTDNVMDKIILLAGLKKSNVKKSRSIYYRSDLVKKN